MGKIIKYGISYGGNGGSSENSYNDLEDKPSINNIELSGNKTTEDLGLFDGDYNNLDNKPTIPTKTSDLTNDSKFVTDNPTFTEAQTRANIVSGETFATILGKIMKYFTDLKTVAFTNSYTDLDNKPTIPSAQIQSDWSQSDNTQVDYIKNKPTIPTVNNATLTIQKNGATVNTFTANASSNVTANITVPTKTSEITNDSNFVASTSATWKNIVGAWSSAVQANVGATSVSVSNPMNSTNVTVDPFCENSSGTQIGIKTMSVTASTITLTFDALAVATTFKCRVMSN